VVFQPCHRSKLPASGVCIHHHEHHVQAGKFGRQFTEESTTHSLDLKVDETGTLFGLATVPVKNVSPSHHRFKCEAEENTGGVLSQCWVQGARSRNNASAHR
jgi:hypothetical protein